MITVLMAHPADDERLQRRSAVLWLSAIVALAVAVIIAALRRGLAIEIAWISALITLGLFAALAAGYVRYSRCPADLRLGVAMGSLFAIFVAGSAGGLISIIGQTFAYPLIDAPLAAADRALGLTAIDVVAAVVAWPGLATLLHLAYIATVPLILISVVALALLGRANRAWELCAAFAFCMIIATLCSLFFPAAAPFEYLQMPGELRAKLPDNAGVYHLQALHGLRAADQFEINFFRLDGVVTFPSFHTAMAAMTAAAWRDDRRLRWPMLLFNLVVIVSTIPIGGHYLVDLPGGLLCWALIFFLGPRFASRREIVQLTPATA